MSEENKNLSAIADTAIDRALSDIQGAFATMNWEYTFDMLRKAVYITADSKIIEDCEVFMKETEQGRLRISEQTAYTDAEKYTKHTLAGNDYLKKQDFLFLKRFMLLLHSNNYYRYRFGPKTRETGLQNLEDKLGGRKNE